MNYKLRHSMAYKARVRTNEEQEGVARIVEAVRLKRIEGTKPQHKDVKNVEGVGKRGVGAVSDY